MIHREKRYKEKFELARERIAINKKDADILREANGLRNRIIHRNNRVDDMIAKQSMENLLPHLKNLLDRLVEASKKI